MAYADNIAEKEKIIIPSKNGLFVTPEGGVVQTKTNISCSQRYVIIHHFLHLILSKF